MAQRVLFGVLLLIGVARAAPAPRIELKLQNEAGPSYHVVRARASLDGALLFEHDAQTGLAPQAASLYAGVMSSGMHALELYVAYEGGVPVFGYVSRYRFHMRARATISMKPGRDLLVTLRVFERSDITISWENRIDFEVRATPREAMLDVQTLPVEKRELTGPDGGIAPEPDTVDPATQAKLDALRDKAVAEVLREADAKREAALPRSKSGGGRKTAVREGAAGAKDCLAPEVHFGFGSFSLSPAEKHGLEALSACALRAPELHLRIAGHCDARGSVDYNRELGRWRAESVARFLVSRGISASRLATVSFGKDHPLCSEDNEACHQRNRRASVESVSP